MMYLVKAAFHIALPVFRAFCLPVNVSLCVTNPLTQLCRKP